MYKGTTPTIRWNIKNSDLDFEDISEIWMTFKDSSNYIVNKTLSDINLNDEDRTISYEFTQEETLKFKIGIIETQLRILLSGGQVFATSIKEFTMDKILKGGIIE